MNTEVIDSASIVPLGGPNVYIEIAGKAVLYARGRIQA